MLEHIVYGNDYFTARTARGLARIGIVGGTYMDFYSTHPLHACILSQTTEAEVEGLARSLGETYGIEWRNNTAESL